MLYKIILTSFLIQFFSYTYAQTIERQVIGIGGGSTELGSTHISFTIGESIIGTVSNNESTLTQGFQQPGQILSSVASLEEAPITVYPNPVNDRLIIEELYPIEFEYLQITDQLGRTVLLKHKSKLSAQLSLDKLAGGIYYLNLYENGRQLFQPKIISKISPG